MPEPEKRTNCCSLKLKSTIGSYCNRKRKFWSSWARMSSVKCMRWGGSWCCRWRRWRCSCRSAKKRKSFWRINCTKQNATLISSNCNKTARKSSSSRFRSRMKSLNWRKNWAFCAHNNSSSFSLPKLTWTIFVKTYHQTSKFSCKEMCSSWTRS